MMQEETNQRRQSRILLDEAFDALTKDDLQQASENGWGAAALMLKAVAEQRGWEHEHDRDLYRIVSRLRLETRKPELSALFGASTSLRFNSSHNWLATQDVEDHLRRVDQFVTKLEKPLADSPERVAKKQLEPPSRERSRLFLDQAYKELSKGYLVEASEKGWLAAFEMARVMGQQRGCPILDQGDFIRFIGNQRSETEDSEWTTMISSANNLHMNALENWYDYGFIKFLLESVERLMDKAEALLDTSAQTR